MDTIKIFLAGAKSLQEQRLRLKALANAFNFKYTKGKHPVSIQMCSYEDYGDHQSICDNFIRNEADLVVFVLERGIGKETEAELRLAYGTWNKRQRPEIMTFVRATTEGDADKAQLEQVLKEMDDIAYEDYEDMDDLVAKAKEHILAFVDQYLRDNQSPAVEGGNETKQTTKINAFWGVCSVYYALAGFAWMLLYTLVGEGMGLSLVVYLIGILLLTVFWIVAANLVARRSVAAPAKPTVLENYAEDMRQYVAHLRDMSDQYGRPDTTRLWEQLIGEAESIPPRHFASKKTRLSARAQQLINY